MNTKILKLNEKQYETIKDLSDKDFGKLMKSVCEYVYYAKVIDTKDKLLNLYFNTFKEKIDEARFFQETGSLGGLKSRDKREKERETSSIALDIVSKMDLDEAVQNVLDALFSGDKEENKEEEKL